MNKKLILASIMMFALPVLALAQITETVPTGKYNTVSGIFNAILTPVYIVAAGLTVLMVIVAGILFITANGNADQVGKARTALIWAVAGLGVAILAFSIQAVVQTYF